MHHRSMIAGIRISVFLACIAVGVSVQLGSDALAQMPQMQDEPAIKVVAEIAAAEIIDPVVIRSTQVTIDLPKLSRQRGGDFFKIQTAPDSTMTIRVDAFRQSGPQRMHWRGRVEDRAGSEVTMVRNGGALVGLVRLPEVGTFRIRTDSQRRQVFEQLNVDAYPPCGTNHEHMIQGKPAADPKPDDAPPAGAEENRLRNGEGLHHAQQQEQDFGSAGGIAGLPTQPAQPLEGCLFIDVLIVYTPQARDFEGGIEAVEAVAHLAIDLTNQANSNSDIHHGVRLAHVAEVDYLESGSFQQDLHRLRDTDDGHMDSVHDLRDEFGADLVALLVGPTDSSICGIAYLMVEPSDEFQSSAFSVSNTSCVVGNITFEHEIGHNMGCHHDHATWVEQGGGAPIFPYSFGLRFVGTNGINYGTVMSYGPNRIPYFSNPNVLYQGTPTGNPERSKLPADNARTHNETAAVVRDFRKAAGSELMPSGWTTLKRLDVAELLANDHFGVSLAMDGDLAVVGAHTTSSVAPNRGAAYVYRRQGNPPVWIEEAQLTASDGAANDQFGISVGVLANGIQGEVVIVGATGADYSGFSNVGAAYVFVKATGQSTWQQMNKLTPLVPASNDLFGRSVAISRVGTIGPEVAIIGAHLQDTNAGNQMVLNNAGAAYIFRNGVQPWHQEAKIVASDRAAGDQFGISVAIHGGDFAGEAIALVGAWLQDGAAMDAGAVYVFGIQNTIWTQLQKVTASDAAAGDQFGYSLALSRNPKTEQYQAIVGAWKAAIGKTLQAGAAYVYTRPFTFFQQHSKLVASKPAAIDQFGNAVAMFDNKALVGAHLRDTELISNGGAVFVYQQSEGGTWELLAEMKQPGAQDENLFGYSVVMDVGKLDPYPHALIGTWSDDHFASGAGSAFSTRYFPPTDCNQNGVLDSCDISLGDSLDLNQNGVPDECECVGDIVVDGIVNVDDLVALLGSWGDCIGCPADLIGDDNLVSVDDLVTLLGAWGPCP